MILEKLSFGIIESYIDRISEENKDIEILSVFHSARDLKKAASEEWEL